MPKLAVKRDTDYRLTVMIRGEMAAQEISIERRRSMRGWRDRRSMTFSSGRRRTFRKRCV